MLKQSSFLIKPASSLCNMNCKYCFYYDVAHHRKEYSKGIMNHKTVEILIKKALEESQEVTFAFQGGEPTVAGLEYFQNFVETVKMYQTNQKVHYAIQTNGLLIDQEWIHLFKENDFLVGLSLDGFVKNHDMVRLQGHKGTYKHIINTLKLLKEGQIDYNVLTVLTRQLAKQPQKLYQFYKSHHIKHIQLIPCLPELDHSTDNYHLTPEGFYSFYETFFELWYKDLKRKEYMSVSLFEDLMMIFQGNAPRTCGMLGNCHVQMIVESNGDIYPCDFYAIDEYKLGNIVEDSLMKIRESEKAKLFLEQKKRTSSLCMKCKFQKICHGNCKRMNVVYFNDNKYCGYQRLLKKTYEKFYSIGRNVI